MPNSVTWGTHELICVLVQGNQTKDSVKHIEETCREFIKKLRGEKKRVLILVDLMSLGKTHSDARKVGVELVKKLDFDKLAVYGQDLYTKHLVNFVVAAAGKGIKVRYFFSDKEARAWLLSV